MVTGRRAWVVFVTAVADEAAQYRRKDLDKQQREARSANSDAHARDARLQRALADVRGSLWQSPAMWG